MNIFKIFQSKKNKGQTMVEFALVLPVLLLVVLGLMEAGRLLFIYGTVTTASRQAVRYGSATGDNGAGTLKHLDCAGIEAAAEEMGFILPISSVDITYTRGGVIFADCDTTTSTYPDPTADLFINGDRIEITTESDYSPMVPIGAFADFTISTESKRTIFIGITVIATAGPAAPAAEFTFTKSANPATFVAAGDEIVYTFTMQNTGSFDLTASVDDPMLGGAICSGISLPQGTTKTCSATYTITDADVIAKVVNNTATASATDGTDTIYRQASATVTLADIYEISLTKTPNKSQTTTKEEITYTYTITNLGNQNLDTFNLSDVTSTGTNVPVTCPSATVVPGGSIACTGKYTITDADLNAGEVVNIATASASANSGANVTPEVTATATVITKVLSLTINTLETTYLLLGDEINYTYTLSNLGAEAINNIVITDDMFPVAPDTAIICASTTIAAGGSTTCTHIHTVTQDDLDLGELINNATATGNDSIGPVTSNTATKQVDATQAPAVTFEITGTTFAPDETGVTGTVTFAYKITNTGNVTLTTPYAISHPISEQASATISCSSTPDLLPDAELTTCEGTYLITDADVLAGSVISTASIEATLKVTSTHPTAGVTSVVATSNEYTFITYGDARLEIIEMTAQVNEEAFVYTVPSGNTIPYEVEAGNQIVFSYKLKNTGGKELTQPYSIIDNFGTFSCDSQIPTNLNLQDEGSCTKDGANIYTVQGNEGTFTYNALANAFEPIGSATVTSPSKSMIFTVVTPATCSLSHSGAINAGSTSPTWTITNNSGVSITIASIQITWHNTNSTRQLKDITLEGHGSVWAGNSSSGLETAAGSWAIGTGDTNIDLTFGKAPGTFVRAEVRFSDSVCSPIVLNSP